MEHFTPLTLDNNSGVVWGEDTVDIWNTVKQEAIDKVRRTKSGTVQGELPMIDEQEVEKSFWIIRPDDWVVNRKLKGIVLLEFKRTVDTSETYYHDMRKVVEKQHTPILTGLKSLPGDRDW